MRGEEDGDRGEELLEPHHQLRPRGGVLNQSDATLAAAVSTCVCGGGEAVGACSFARPYACRLQFAQRSRIARVASAMYMAIATCRERSRLGRTHRRPPPSSRPHPARHHHLLLSVDAARRARPRLARRHVHRRVDLPKEAEAELVRLRIDRAEITPRSRRGHPEIAPRSSRDRAAVIPRSSRDRAEIIPRSRRDHPEIAPRSARDRAEWHLPHAEGDPRADEEGDRSDQVRKVNRPARDCARRGSSTRGGGDCGDECGGGGGEE